MTIKKGIVVKRQTYSEGASGLKEVHKLDDAGVFSLGNDAEDTNANNIQIKGKLNIVGPNGSGAADTATDVKTMMSDVETAITTLTGSATSGETKDYNDIDTDITDFQGLIGVTANADRTIAAPAWTALHSTGGTYLQGSDDTFKKVDTRLDAGAKDIADRIATLQGTGANSVRGLIAQQVNGTLNGGSLAADDTTAIDTIWELQKAFMSGTTGYAAGTYSTAAWADLSVVTQEIDPLSISSSLNAYIEEAEADMIDSVAASQNTLAKLETMLNTEKQRYTTKDLLLRQELSEACTTVGITNSETATDAMDATLTVDFGATGAYNATATNQLETSRIVGKANFKAVDEQISIAIQANKGRLDGMESHLDLAGDLTANGAVTLTGLSFTENAGKMKFPSYTGAAFRAKIGAYVADSNAIPASQANMSGQMVFITTGDSNDQEFNQDKKFYFCENGRWLPSSFIVS